MHIAGPDFELQQTVTTWETEKAAFCKTWIQPNAQLVTNDLESGPGSKHVYCVRALVPLEIDGAAMTAESEYTCTTVVSQWVGEVDGYIQTDAGTPVGGTMVNAFRLACDVEADGCSTPAINTAGSASYELTDGGFQLSMTMYSASLELVEADRAAIQTCAHGLEVGDLRAEHPDAIVGFGQAGADAAQGTTRSALLWFREFPACWLQVRYARPIPGSSYDDFTASYPEYRVVAFGTVGMEHGQLLGYGFHVVVERPPSWRVMATKCSRMCQLCSFQHEWCRNVGGDIFCATWSQWCPRELFEVPVFQSLSRGSSWA